MSLSLESAFTRLSIQPSSTCHQCRRAFTSLAQRRQQPRNATTAFADMLTSDRSNRQRQSQRQPASPRPAQDSLAASALGSSPATPSPTSTSGWSMMQDAVRTATQARRDQAQRQMLLDQERGWNRSDIERQAVHRRWKVGDVYSPHDLTGIEMAKWKKLRRRPKPKYDVIDQLGLKNMPGGIVGGLYKNFSVMSEYISSMGRIKHSNDTGLRPVNQRKMAKAIRRAMGVGILMPGTHRHPEILRTELNRGKGF